MEEHGCIRAIEVETSRKDGNRIWVSLSGRVIRDSEGKILRYESTLGDITRRKLAERRSAAEHHVARILAAAPSLTEALSLTLQAIGETLDWEWCGVWRVDPEKQVLRCNEVWYPTSGEQNGFGVYCRSAFFSRGTGLPGRVWATGQPIWIPNITADAGFTGSDLARKVGYRSAVAFPILSGTDILGVIDFFSKEVREPDPALVRMLVAVGNQLGQFIERRRIEEERDRFFELSADLLCVAGFDGVFRIINSAWTTVLGWSKEELTARPYIEFVHPDDRVATAAEAESLTARGISTLTFDNRYLCKDGSYRWLSWRAVPDLTRRVIYASARDTTEKRQAEIDLLLRNRAMQAATQGILIMDAEQPDYPIIYASPGFERMTGYEAAEVIGRNNQFLQGPNTESAAMDKLLEAKNAGEPCMVEFLNYRKDQSQFWSDLSVAPVLDDSGRLTHFVGVMTDVTARRKLEAQLRHSQKMDAIGKLAGGVAHDFNNLLTIISGYSDLLLQDLPPDDPNREFISAIHHAGERSAGLTRQLLAFSRQQILALRVLDLNKVVADAEKMLRRLIGENIRLSASLMPGLWPVRTDPGQIEQVLLNLAVNARDAMPDGGQLTMETQNVDLDESYADSHTDARPGPHVLIAVADTGCGMSPDVMSRIFEPFFTTKDPGKGTGLGLATVHGIVKQSGGHIGVYSEMGVGTIFKVYLPRAEGSSSGPQSWPRSRKPDRGTETILLVEDEDRVRAFSRHILVGCGYNVLEAADGLQALEIAAAATEPIHLLVTDVVMPRSGGRAVAEGVSKHHPGIRVLFVSGYTDDSVVRHGVLEAGVNFLQKPFSPVVLAQKVRETLDTAR
jgi:two-component system, cell cycle sensor histidine kinase and response regulator CckA